METDVSDASNPFSVEDNNLTLDTDLYDADGYDIPDPGLLQEKNGEMAWPRPQDGPPKSSPQAQALSTRNTRFRGQSPNPQGPPEGPWLPATSRDGGPRPHSGSASTTSLQIHRSRSRSRSFLPGGHGGKT